MRDHKWLMHKLAAIWTRYFSDVQQINPVLVRFGRSAKTRLGSIKLGRKKINTYITLTGFLQDERVPEFVIEAVLAHELAHYAHGFNSPHQQLLHYPHKHRVVDRELTKRGLGDIVLLQKKWLKDNWPTIVRG